MVAGFQGVFRVEKTVTSEQGHFCLIWKHSRSGTRGGRWEPKTTSPLGLGPSRKGPQRSVATAQGLRGVLTRRRASSAEAGCRGFSCCRALALGAQASVVVARGLSSCGLQALKLRLSSCGARA